MLDDQEQDLAAIPPVARRICLNCNWVWYGTLLTCFNPSGACRTKSMVTEQEIVAART